jgi:hypothetical protein
MLNRTVDWSPDESMLQTENILRAEAKEASKIKKVDFSEEEKTVLALHQILLSEPVNVVIPYAESLVDLVPQENIRIRRDFKKLLALVKASTSLHRRQRVVLRLAGQTVPVALANKKDLLIVMNYCWETVIKSSYGLPKPVLEFFEKLQKNIPVIMSQSTLQLPDLDTIWFRDADAAKATGMAEKTTEIYLRQLYKAGYLRRRDVKPRGYEYQICKVLKIEEDIKAKILSPEFFKFEDFVEWAKRELHTDDVRGFIYQLYMKWLKNEGLQVEIQ